MSMFQEITKNNDLESRIELETNFFDNNLFDIELFSNDFHFDFSLCKNSVMIEKYRFTNFMKNKKELYKFIKKEYYRFLNNDFHGPDGILSDYNIKDFGGVRRKLIKKIICKATKKYPDNLPIIRRLTNKNNKDIQLFFYETNKGVFRVVAIDIFHLIIPANDMERPEILNDGIEKFKINKENPINLNEIIK